MTIYLTGGDSRFVASYYTDDDDCLPHEDGEVEVACVASKPSEALRFMADEIERRLAKKE